jgi:pyruvate dehydrogenase E1 component alpha subunit
MEERMPRKEIDLPYRVDYLSVLDENGKLDKELEPEIGEELLLKLYRMMMTGRSLDDRLLSLQRQGRIGTFGPITGQEAAQLGAIAVLEPSDWFVPSFRETAAELWRGRTMDGVILTFGGYNEGARGHSGDCKNLPVAIPVGTQVLHAVGVGWSIKYREEKNVVMTFFGDGGTSQGDFHEGMNFAGVYQLPVIFVCQNNQWAISVPRSKQTRSKTLAQKALAYGFPGIQVDGNDVLAVYAAAREAADRARSGEGPTLIECVTYRMRMHTTADDPKRYRKEEEVKTWEKRDPIARFEKYLKKKGVLSDEKIKKLEGEIEEEIKKAVDKAEKQMKEFTDPLAMFDHVYAEPTTTLEEQRKELAEEAGREE